MRRRFSEKQGLVEVRTAIQLDSMDERLQSRLWTQISNCFLRNMSNLVADDDFTYQIFYDWTDDFLGRPIDEIDRWTSTNIERMKRLYFGSDWAFCYDVVQFFVDYYSINIAGEPYSELRDRADEFIAVANAVLENEKSGYRIVSGEVTNIVAEREIASIEESVELQDGFSSAANHINSALRLYSDRKKPDYANSIKEAVSAIEAGFSVINQSKSKSMSDAVKLAGKRGFELPPALRSGILSIYGWTSDEDGVRHALFDKESSVGPDEAKMMLVLCSALINYMKSKHIN